MGREVLISFYLFLFRIIFLLCKTFPLKKKTVCVASFGDNIDYTVQTLRQYTPEEEIVILKDAACNYPFDETEYHVLRFQISHPFAFIQSIYHLATAETILVDNYFGFLAVTDFKDGVTCIQLWHAVGAMKQFGLNDPSNSKRSVKAIERFQQVYERFHYVTVGSEHMATIFRENFGLPNQAILRTGVPRTDLFFDKDKKRKIIQRLKERFPVISSKKVILYAPTFRKNNEKDPMVALNTDALYEALADDYALFVKLHPSVHSRVQEKYDGFIYDVSDYYNVNHLLLITDILISDYSSIPFEFALLDKPMIFYPYDLKEYKQTSGLIENYEQMVPGPVVFQTADIIRTIKEQAYDMEKIKGFSNQWNQYSKGNASEQLTQFLAEPEQKRALI